MSINFLHAEKNWKKVEINFIWYWWIYQPKFLHVDRNSRKPNCNRKVFGKVWSWMLWVNQLSRFININQPYIEIESMNQCNILTWRLFIDRCQWHSRSFFFKLSSLIVMQQTEFHFQGLTNVCWHFLLPPLIRYYTDSSSPWKYAIKGLSVMMPANWRRFFIYLLSFFFVEEMAM